MPDKELNFYRGRLDKVSGDLIRMQYNIASLANEIKQLQNGYHVILKLQQSVFQLKTLEKVLEMLADLIVQHVHMDRVVILRNDEPGSNYFSPIYVKGYSDEVTKEIVGLKVKLDTYKNARKSFIFKKNSPYSLELITLSEQLLIPFFVCTALNLVNRPVILLIAGRIYERKPMISYMPLTRADEFIFESIAGVIESVDHQFIHQKLLDEERTRVSRDMHDDLGSRLSMVSLLCDSINFTDADQAEPSKYLDLIRSNISEVIDNISNIIWALNPENNNLYNLLAYIHEFASNYLEMNEITLNYHEPPVIIQDEINPIARKNIFLVTKEAVHNIARHSGASVAELKVSQDNSYFSLEIKDNGKGFEKTRQFGNGLKNMKKRMVEIGGVCNTESIAGIGTTITLRVLLRNLLHN